MQAPDAVGLVDQQAGGPERVVDVVPAGLQLGGQAAIEDDNPLASE